MHPSTSTEYGYALDQLGPVPGSKGEGWLGPVPGSEGEIRDEALLALKQNKSPRADGCPDPRPRWAGIDGETGEVIPLPCSRNTCPHCRRRNVQTTAAKMGLNQTLTDRPITHAVLSTTRTWVDTPTLREGWRQMSRNVARETGDVSRYAWFREWTEGRNDGIRRTHYHSTWALDNDEQAQAVAEISNHVWGKLAGAYSEKAHGWKPVYDAGGLTRYVAGLIGHHLKANQAPPPGWSGRRFGTSRGFYAIDSRELDKRAKALVRDARLRYHLEQVTAQDVPDGFPAEILDELVTDKLERFKDRPPMRIVSVRHGFWD